MNASNAMLRTAPFLHSPFSPSPKGRLMHMTQSAACLLLLVSFSRVAAAQTPVISPSATEVAPGQSVAVTLTGAPNANFAVIGSSTNAGFSYDGVALAVGPDVVILVFGCPRGLGKRHGVGEAALPRHHP